MSLMLQNIPTHVIAGPLGAGKTSLIKHLLAQRPANERWAVLINEFGQIGLDAALLTQDDDGIAMGEVAGGCLCCVNGAPFQVGLGRLLRRGQAGSAVYRTVGPGPSRAIAQAITPSALAESASDSAVCAGVGCPSAGGGQTLAAGTAAGAGKRRVAGIEQG
ncbi:GTP-binding protein [Pseudomonas sp. H2_G03]